MNPDQQTPTNSKESNSPRGISARPAGSDDQDFLFQVYCSTRQEEVHSWGWTAEQAAAFLRMQFDARRRSYAAAYPSGVESILDEGGTPIGSLLVRRSPKEIQLVDIALLPDYRNRGIGTRIISELIREAANSKAALRLSVLAGNPAIRLYERLGFLVTDKGTMYLEMEHGASPGGIIDAGSRPEFKIDA